MVKVIDAIVEATLIIKINDIREANDQGAVAYETLKRLLTYKNPKFIENEKWGYSNFKTLIEIAFRILLFESLLMRVSFRYRQLNGMFQNRLNLHRSND